MVWSWTAGRSPTDGCTGSGWSGRRSPTRSRWCATSARCRRRSTRSRSGRSRRRTTGVADADLQRLVDDGAILRTHALRPTWHFVAPDDIGWIQALTGPRVHAFNAYYYRQFGIDDETSRRKTNALIADALAGGNHLTRKELAAALAAGGFPATGIKLAYVVMRAELERLIVNGPMRGKQHTYALVEERAPRRADAVAGDEALAELTGRFFTTHGPATVKDFAWWSSLTVAQIKARAGAGRRPAERRDGRGQDRVVRPGRRRRARAGVHGCCRATTNTSWPTATRSSRSTSTGSRPRPDRYTDNMLFHPIVRDGQVVGFWRRLVKGKGLALELELARALPAGDRRALDEELARHEAFAGVPVEVAYV